MKHFNHEATRAERTPKEWLPLGAQITAAVNKWPGRGDLAVFIGEGATEGLAAALFKPAIAEVEVNVNIAFGETVKPESIGDFSQRDTHYEWPKATGMILHEAMHARYSKWDMTKAHADLKRDEYEALILLEESRIEALGVALSESNRAFLRACAMEVVLAETEGISSNTRAAAQTMALVQGRVLADVLDPHEVEEILSIAKDQLGEDIFSRMTEILAEYQMHDQHSNIEPMYPLAREWAQLVRDRAEEQGEQQGEGGEGGEGEGGEGSGMSAFAKALSDALADAADDMTIATSDELADLQESEEWKDIAKARAEAAAERGEHEREAAKVFGKGTGEGPAGGTFSTLIEERAPKADERVAAVTVARLLEKAKYRDRDITVVRTAVPGGRLRTRALVQGAAQRAAGRVPDVEPWRKKVRKHVDQPTLRMGVLVDISGSMSAAMGPMATTAWVMSEAARRIQAKCAMAYYGNSVFPTLKPGQHLGGVKVYDAPDMTEKFDEAFKAVDGALNLLHGDGARLLVVVSDGCYTPTQQEAARKWMLRCQQEGVAVLWLTFDNSGYYAGMHTKGTDAVVLTKRMNPAAAAAEIGRAAATAMEKVGQRNAA